MGSEMCIRDRAYDVRIRNDMNKLRQIHSENTKKRKRSANASFSSQSKDASSNDALDPGSSHKKNRPSNRNSFDMTPESPIKKHSFLVSRSITNSSNCVVSEDSTMRKNDCLDHDAVHAQSELNGQHGCGAGSGQYDV